MFGSQREHTANVPKGGDIVKNTTGSMLASACRGSGIRTALAFMPYTAA